MEERSSVDERCLKKEFFDGHLYCNKLSEGENIDGFQRRGAT